jgi:hypothetical protein
MRTVALLLAVAGLAGCATQTGTFEQRFAIRRQCRESAGPEPYAGANLFGMVGAVVKTSQPEWKEWASRLEDCTKRKTAELDGSATSDARAAPPSKR